MIKFENFEVTGWEHAIRGMRNPLNSWEKSDSDRCDHITACHCCPHCGPDDYYIPCDHPYYVLGPNDYDLMMKLRNAGTDHRKFMRMITVYVDITAPLYWWKEFDTYKVGTVVNSCSTMHTIHKKEFELEDFSCEKLFHGNLRNGDYVEIGANDEAFTAQEILDITIDALNHYRKRYLQFKDGCDGIYAKELWYQMIQLLPTSYNQKRTVMMNYEVLANIYKSRKNHKLDEWRELCAWIETLPYAQLITGLEAFETGDEQCPSNK